MSNSEWTSSQKSEVIDRLVANVDLRRQFIERILTLGHDPSGLIDNHGMCIFKALFQSEDGRKNDA